MKFSIVTFGCRVNQADSLAIEADLVSRGAPAVAPDQADVVIVNTCSVTASADQGARQTIRRIARQNPRVRIIATGCYATRCPDEVAALPGIAALVPNGSKRPLTFFREITNLLGTGSLASDEGACGRPLEPGLMGRTAWTLRVQTGCEEACSYCIIPSTRGASRSRELTDVMTELDRIVAAGYKEAVLTGVHLGSYGRDLTPRASLAALIAELAARNSAAGGPLLLRVSSLEPMDFPDAIVESVAPHFHLPLQHASDRILRRMRRPYTLEDYAALVSGIRRRLPHAAIGSDIMVGYPGETDADFGILTDYLERSPLTHLHVFPYSERPGTEAAALPGKIDGGTIKRRAETVRQISRRLHERFRAGLVGTTRPALTIDDGTAAITDNYVRVAVPPGHTRNERITVTL